MNINKKAQAQNMMMMILTLIIIGFIVLFGTKIYNNLTSQGDQINYVKLKNSVQSEITSISDDYHSKKEVSLTLPNGVNELCLVDLTKNPPDDFYKSYPIIFNYWKDFHTAAGSNVVRNAFLVSKTAQASFYVENFEIPDTYNGFLCFEEQRSQINFWVEGLGSKAKVTIS